MQGKLENSLFFPGTWGRNRRQVRNNHRSLVPSISDPVPILQPPTATVSEYAKKIEILANDLANGSAMTPEMNGAGKEFSFYFLFTFFKINKEGNITWTVAK